MADIKWTKSQSNAFMSKGGDVIVCAAAGSGKTAVLTERVIRAITDDPPVDITSMLIVTFTKAAASELKSKISRAITEKMGKEQGNSRLRHQLLSLDRAQISTIDSFCLSVISSHFSELGLPASVKVGGEADLELMRNDIMNRTIDAAYASGDKNFLNLIDNFSRLRDDNVVGLFLGIYNTVSSYPEGVNYIKESAERLDNISEKGLSGSIFDKQFVKSIDRALSHYINVYKIILDELKNDGTQQKSISVIEDELKKLETLYSYSDYAVKKFGIQDFEFLRLPRNDSKSESYLAFTDARDALKKTVKNYAELICGDESNDKISAAMSARLCRSLWKLLENFEKNYAAEKRRYSIIDFADAERMTYNLLIKDGKPTDAAKVIADSLSQIYIDEYQDINRIQDDIFGAVSHNNRFMVGDIKQSIYGFRNAVPEIFSGYRESFPDYDCEKEQDNSRIFLSDNFRSDKHILDFANAVCNKLFLNGSGRIPYDIENDSLRFPNDSVTDKKTDIILVSPDDESDQHQCEAAYVADKIRSLIENGRSPSDIAILMRKSSDNETLFRVELMKRGIPVETTESDDFLSKPEILLVLSLLGAIDNPRRDITLAGALKSPVFDITLDDLVMLRRDDKSVCLYESLCNAVSEGRFPKGEYFLSFLNDCRKYSEANSTDKIVRYIYEKTSLPSIVSGKIGGKEANRRLRAFYDFARSFESGSFRGLHNFMRYIRQIEDGEKSAIKYSGCTETNAVKIMSIHKSKGLEFPVVFLCCTDGKVNLNDTTRDLLAEHDMGFAFKLSVANGLAKYTPLTYRAVAEKITDNAIDEEMRVLYVALTRAKNELYITAGIKKDKLDNFTADCENGGKFFDFYTLRMQQCFMKWILSALYSDLSSEKTFKLSVKTINSDFLNYPIALDSTQKIDLPEAEENMDIDEIRKRITFEYPHKAESELPTKASVSKLYPEYLDDNEVGDLRYRFDNVPEFLVPERRPTAAEKGTATHLFMQFCDFEKVRMYGAENELARLVADKFINRESAELVNIKSIKKFFTSALFEEMKNAKEIYREYRFLVGMPASEFTSDDSYGEKIADVEMLVQGVIDCFFVLPDGTIKLVDYKTDYVDYNDDIEIVEETLKNEHKNQLAYYSEAITKLCGKKVSHASIYAFAIGREIAVDI